MADTTSVLKNVTHRNFTVRPIIKAGGFVTIAYGNDPRFTTFEEAKACADAKAAAHDPKTSDYTHYRIVRAEYGVAPRCRKAAWVFTDMLDVEVQG